MTTKKILCLLAAACCLACNTERPGYRLAISAVMDTPLARAALESDGAVSFVSGDRIAVFNSDGTPGLFTTTAVHEDGSADFGGVVDYESDSYVAMYPYQGGSLSSTAEVMVTIPDRQTAVAGSFDPAANISIGRTVNVGGQIHSLELKNVCSLLKFSVPEGESYQVAQLIPGLDPESTIYLSGKIVFGVEDEPHPTYVVEGNDFDVQLSGTIEGGNWYYIAVCPAVLNAGFSLSLYKSATDFEKGDYSVVKYTEKTVTLKRGTILDLGVIGSDATASFEPVSGETAFIW